MVKRQLFAVVLAITGLGSFGCGKGNTTAVFDDPSTSDQPPSNPDQPRSGGDQASVNADQPTTSSTDAPPGGGIGPLCVALCNRILSSECSGDTAFGDVREQGCDGECVVPPDLIPCESQLADVFRCYLSLPTLCVASGAVDPEGQGQEPSIFANCRQAIESYGACSDAYKPPKVDSVKGCFPDGGCECADDCTTCLCENPGDAASCADECQPRQ